MFDINGLYNSQNERICAVNCGEANGKGGVKQKQKFPQKVMVWLSVCLGEITPLVNHKVYIENILPIARKLRKMIGR